MKTRKTLLTLLVFMLTFTLFGVRQTQAGSLTTIFAGDNSHDGNMFDVDVFGNALTVTSLDLNLEAGTHELFLYTKAGTFSGSESTPGDWTLIDNISGVVSNGDDVPTPVDFADFVLAANSKTAFYVSTGAGSPNFNYTDGTVVDDVFASNSDLQIREGLGVAYPFGQTFSPRIWNGTINYDVVPEPMARRIKNVPLVLPRINDFA